MTQLYAFHFGVDTRNVQHGGTLLSFTAIVVADKYEYALSRLPSLVPEPDSGYYNHYALISVQPHAMIETQPKSGSPATTR